MPRSTTRKTKKSESPEQLVALLMERIAEDYLEEPLQETLGDDLLEEKSLLLLDMAEMVVQAAIFEAATMDDDGDEDDFDEDDE